MLLDIHPQDPQPRLVKQVVECLNDGGVIIYPTDTIYGLGCSIYKQDAIERIARIKSIPLKQAHFSFVCADLSHISDFTKSVDTPIFRLLKATLPGPYTYILNANKAVPKLLKTKKDTVGIRVPNHTLTHALIDTLGHPIISTSLPMDDEVAYYTDASLIYDKFKDQVDIVIDGGIGGIIPSTIIDCTKGYPEVLRQGLGPIDAIS